MRRHTIRRRRQFIGPITRIIVCGCPQHTQNGFIYSLSLPIGTRVEWSGAGSSNTRQFRQFTEQFRLEVPTVVRMELIGHSKSGKENIIKGVHTSARLFIRKSIRFGPLGHIINGDYHTRGAII